MQKIEQNYNDIKNGREMTRKLEDLYIVQYSKYRISKKRKRKGA